MDEQIKKKDRPGLTFRRILSPLAIVLMVAIVLMTFTNALLRYTIGRNVLSFEEYSRFCFVWICYIGTVIAFEEKRHICVTLISDALKGVAKTAATLVSQLVVLATSGVVLYAGILYMRRAVTYQTAATGTNMGIVVIGLPLMMASIIYLQLVDIYRQYFGNTARKEEGRQ